MSTAYSREEMWSFTGEDNQLWVWSESGEQLLNQATGRPLAVGGYTRWTLDNGRLLSLGGGKVTLYKLLPRLHV